MILITKMDGSEMMLNADWIQRIEKTPDTVITLTNGDKLMVRDKLEIIVKRFKHYKREVFIQKGVVGS